jgi:hypothetical protein
VPAAGGRQSRPPVSLRVQGNGSPASVRARIESRPLTAKTTVVTTNTTAVLKSSDRWMPMALPTRPTVTPLKVRKLRLAIENSLMTRLWANPRTAVR